MVPHLRPRAVGRQDLCALLIYAYGVDPVRARGSMVIPRLVYVCDGIFHGILGTICSTAVLICDLDMLGSLSHNTLSPSH